MVVILMGVSGSGKTTLGLRLADDLGWTFIDADDFHSPRSVEMMARGEELSDQDLNVWIQALRAQVASIVSRGGNAVLAYTGLKSRWRDQLTVDP